MMMAAFQAEVDVDSYNPFITKMDEQLSLQDALDHHLDGETQPWTKSSEALQTFLCPGVMSLPKLEQ